MNPDPVFEALNGLVVSGDLTEERAQTAYNAIHDSPAADRPVDGASGGQQVSNGWERVSLEAVVVAIGVGLLLTVLSISTARARDSGDLDWSVFLLGVLATGGLLGVAAASWRLVPDPEHRHHLMSWTGAAGAIGAGMMVGIAMDDADLVGYLVGGITVALSAAGYWLVRSNPFVLTGILGLALIYLNVLDDAGGLDDVFEGDNAGIWIGLGLLAFGVVVTGAGWFLPTRVFSALVVGVGVLAGYFALLTGMFVAQSFIAAFSMSPTDSGGGSDLDQLNNDAWLLLGFTGLMIAGWVWCYLRTGHVGFRVLIVAALAMIPVLVSAILAVEHPTWWEVAFGVGGGGLLVALLAKASGRLGGGSGPDAGMPPYPQQPYSSAPAGPADSADAAGPTHPGDFQPPEERSADPDQPSSSS